VPFHGSLGAIAGACIASARFGSALGADRRADWVYVGRLLSAWLIPVILHALFDIPLLTLRQGFDDSGVTHAALQVMGLVVGFGAVALALRLSLHIAGHQKLWPQSSRTSGVAWRRIWGWLVVGAGLGFAGATLVVSAVRQGAIGEKSGLVSLGAGAAMMVVAIVIYSWGTKYLSKSPAGWKSDVASNR
jgi:hypothetical protein